MDNEQQLNIYMYFYSAKVSTSSAVKELYTLINSLLGKITPTPLPSASPRRSPYSFVHKVRQIGDSIDSQVVHPPSHILREHHFSGTPLCGFESHQ